MKKLAASLLALAVVLCGMNVLAAETEQDAYFGSDNSVHFADYNSGVSEYTTVLIRKNNTTGADGVVYVDQRSNGFSDAVNFMLKADPKAGDYTATFGNAVNETKVVKFSIGDVTLESNGNKVTLDQKNKMAIADEPVLQEGLYGNEANGTYKKGFVFTANADQYNSFNRLFLVSEDGKSTYGYFELEKETVVTDGDVAYGIQIYNIPEANKGMNLYLGEASE